MRTIWKCPVLWTGEFAIELPDEASFLSVQDQGGLAQMWFEVDTAAPLRRRCFVVYGTGSEIRDKPDMWREYRGTFQQDGGNLAWHLFELVELAEVVEVVPFEPQPPAAAEEGKA